MADIPVRSRGACDFSNLPKNVQEFVEEKARICQPDSIYLCDGSPEENTELLQTLRDAGMIQPLEEKKNK